MEKKINIAFLWHMHQPLYKDPFKSQYVLPWVLYHSTKDYLDMLSILDEFPSVKQTFNVVPSLIEQIRDYEAPGVNDRYRLITSKDALSLDNDDKIFLMESFFQCNWDNMVKTNERYWSLLTKRGFSSRKADLEDAVRFFNTDEYRDIQFLFNFAWIDPMHVEADVELKRLKLKGRGYSEEDKKTLLAKQTEIVRRIIPKYKEMYDKGAVELTTTPYFHPILPLLCDTDSAKEAMPWAKMPQKRFTHPEDAAMQIRMGLDLFEKTFGRRPSGMWPSEGSVSPKTAEIAAAEGIKWIATDEDILSKSLGVALKRSSEGHSLSPSLYRPYEFVTSNNAISIVFRDRILSDLIGFDYAKIDAEKAADDFMSRLDKIYGMCGDPEKSIVAVILDGENAWETYRNDGGDFLRALYKKISESKTVNPVTVSEFLLNVPGREKLSRLASGSWINGNFRIWIGHEEDNAAWDLISGARETLTAYDASAGAIPEKSAAAWRSLYAAQGSDWFWWYGEDNASMNDADFDLLFRNYIKHAYSSIGAEPPTELDIPILAEERGFMPLELPSGFMNPVIDGTVTNYFEWLSSAPIDKVKAGGAMHGGSLKPFILGMRYGFNTETLFLRFDYEPSFLGKGHYCELPWHFTLVVLYPHEMRIRASIDKQTATCEIHERMVGEDWKATSVLETIGVGSVVELALPFSKLKATSGDEFRFFVDVWGESIQRERWPERGFITIKLPDSNFENEHWVV